MTPRVKFLAAAATAVVAVGTLAGLGAAAAFDGGFETPAPRLAQAAPPAAPPPPAAGKQGGTGPDRATGPRMMHDRSPKDMCVEHVARRIGDRAYLKARLDLKPEQMPLWSAFEKAADEASAKDKVRCASLPAEAKTPPNFMERFNRREDMMKARVESLEAVKPSLQALYAALTPEQKAILDKPAMGGHHQRRG
jgi:hypothetical protein